MAGPESKIQEAVVTYAREKYRGKVIARKFQAGRFGTNGWPDYEFLIGRKECFHIEFKAPGANCTPLQLQRHAELRAVGQTVYVVDSIAAGRSVIDTELQRKKRFMPRSFAVEGA